jgi:hypothetical protein
VPTRETDEPWTEEVRSAREPDLRPPDPARVTEIPAAANARAGYPTEQRRISRLRPLIDSCGGTLPRLERAAKRGLVGEARVRDRGDEGRELIRVQRAHDGLELPPWCPSCRRRHSLQSCVGLCSVNALRRGRHVLRRR